VPRSNRTVKTKEIKTPGFIDLHFHGAFGIDLMRASPEDLQTLSEKLPGHGISAFCPTTLSTDAQTLREVCQRLGEWIKNSAKKSAKGALPLGIHLEGPFINPKASGAHPPDILRPATQTELDDLWEVSQHSLKIITLAPEIHEPSFLKTLATWARKRKIILSLGHSCATKDQAREAFKLGFRNVTHAWNALSFHHRNPGALSAAFGQKSVFLEIIPDQIHVAPEVIEWTQKLHGHDQICFVSDCIPVAGLSEKDMTARPTTFGPLDITRSEGAGRIRTGKNAGALAGGGNLLPEMMRLWLEKTKPVQIARELKQAYDSAQNSLGLSKSLRTDIARRVRISWKIGRHKVQFRVDSR